jgi:hypothetical protein
MEGNETKQSEKKINLSQRNGTQRKVNKQIQKQCKEIQVIFIGYSLRDPSAAKK